MLRTATNGTIFTLKSWNWPMSFFWKINLRCCHMQMWILVECAYSIIIWICVSQIVLHLIGQSFCCTFWQVHTQSKCRLYIRHSQYYWIYIRQCITWFRCKCLPRPAQFSIAPLFLTNNLLIHSVQYKLLFLRVTSSQLPLEVFIYAVNDQPWCYLSLAFYDTMNWNCASESCFT